MFGAIAGGIASALAGGAMSKLFGGGQKAASGGIQGDVLARSEERRVGKECRSRRTTDHSKKNEHFTAEHAVVLEPTDMQIAIAHTAYARLDIITYARARDG